MDSNHRPSPSQSDELPTALTRDGIYTKIPHYEDNFKQQFNAYETLGQMFANKSGSCSLMISSTISFARSMPSL